MALIDTLRLSWGGLARRSWSSAPRPFGERFVACLPTLARRYLARRDRRLIIRANGSSAHLELTAGETREVLGTFDLGGREPLPGGLADCPKDPHRRTILLLPASTVLTRRTLLPAQVRDNLATVLRYELDRLSPFRPKQVVYDSLVVGGGKDSARLTLDLALTRRDLVEGWLKRLREAGSPVDQVTWEEAWPKANLLPPAERQRHRQPLLDPGKLILALILPLGAAGTGHVPVAAVPHPGDPGVRGAQGAHPGGAGGSGPPGTGAGAARQYRGTAPEMRVAAYARHVAGVDRTHPR